MILLRVLPVMVIALREQGREVIIVSSGAVAAGLARLGLDTVHPRSMNCRQQRPWASRRSCRLTRRRLRPLVTFVPDPTEPR